MAAATATPVRGHSPNQTRRNGEDEDDVDEGKAEKKKYKVIRVVPESDGHLKLLERLELNGADLEVNPNKIWKIGQEKSIEVGKKET